jgi:uncharacterized protein YjdB
MKKFITILSVMAALAAAFTSCEKEAIVGTADGDGLYLNKTEITLIKGTAEALVATVTPKDAATLSWVSADAAVATVDSEGVVTAVGAGETVVSATAGGMKVECLVKVQSPVTSLVLDKTEIVIAKGEQTEINATVGPDDINVPFKYIWTSSDESIFTVTADPEVEGKAIINGVTGGLGTLYAQAGDMVMSIPVTIDVDLEGLIIAGVPTEKQYVGDSFQLEVVKDPIDAIDELSPVWSSSDESVLTVDQNGLVTAVGVGTATITVESNGFTASAEITIYIMTTVSFYPTSNSYTVDEYLSFSCDAWVGGSYMYVDVGNQLRFVVPENIKITEIRFQTYGSYYPFYADVDTGVYDSSQNVWTWTGDASEVTFTVTQEGTYLTGFTVTYKN